MLHAKCSIILYHLSFLKNNKEGRFYFKSHFTDEETEGDWTRLAKKLQDLGLQLVGLPPGCMVAAILVLSACFNSV